MSQGETTLRSLPNHRSRPAGAGGLARWIGAVLLSDRLAVRLAASGVFVGVLALAVAWSAGAIANL